MKMLYVRERCKTHAQRLYNLFARDNNRLRIIVYVKQFSLLEKLYICASV